MNGRSTRVTEEQARALWQRAAELQVAAERQAPESRMLQAADEGGLSLEQVAAAAEGAGIHADFLRIALAEQRLPEAEALRSDAWTGRWLERLVDHPLAIDASRTLAADPATVLATFREVAQGERFQLVAEDLVGEDPVRDGVLVYRVSGSTNFSSSMFLADGRVLLVTIRPQGGGSQIRIRVPLLLRGFNLTMSGVSMGIFGGTTGALAGGIATALGAAAAVAALPVAAGVAVGGVVGAKAFRRLYHWSARYGRTAVDQLLQAVAMEVDERTRRLTG